MPGDKQRHETHQWGPARIVLGIDVTEKLLEECLRGSEVACVGAEGSLVSEGWETRATWRCARAQMSFRGVLGERKDRGGDILTFDGGAMQRCLALGIARRRVLLLLACSSVVSQVYDLTGNRGK